MTIPKRERTNLFPLQDDEYLTAKQFEQLPQKWFYRATDPGSTVIGRVEEKWSSGTKAWSVLAHDVDGNLIRFDVYSLGVFAGQFSLKGDEWYRVQLDGAPARLSVSHLSTTAVTDLLCGDGTNLTADLDGWNQKTHRLPFRVGITEAARERLEKEHKAAKANWNAAQQRWNEVEALPQILLWQPRPDALSIQPKGR